MNHQEYSTPSSLSVEPDDQINTPTDITALLDAIAPRRQLPFKRGSRRVWATPLASSESLDSLGRVEDEGTSIATFPPAPVLPPAQAAPSTPVPSTPLASSESPKPLSQVEDVATSTATAPSSPPVYSLKKEHRGDLCVQERHDDNCARAKAISTMFYKMSASVRKRFEEDGPREPSPQFTKVMENLTLALFKETSDMESAVNECLAVVHKGDHYNDDGDWEVEEKPRLKRRRSSQTSHKRCQKLGRVSPI